MSPASTAATKTTAEPREKSRVACLGPHPVLASPFALSVSCPQSHQFDMGRQDKPMATSSDSRYAWAGKGDVNAFFGLMLDNVAVMIALFSIITSAKPVD